MSSEPPGGHPEPPAPDPEIDRLALTLAARRRDLTDEQRRNLARDLAHRARDYGSDPYAA